MKNQLRLIYDITHGEYSYLSILQDLLDEYYRSVIFFEDMPVRLINHSPEKKWDIIKDAYKKGIIYCDCCNL